MEDSGFFHWGVVVRPSTTALSEAEQVSNLGRQTGTIQCVYSFSSGRYSVDDEVGRRRGRR